MNPLQTKKNDSGVQFEPDLDFIPVEEHPLEPFLPSNARLLMLGSFPPQKKRWSIDFFYPNLPKVKSLLSAHCRNPMKRFSAKMPCVV